eukprot:jgi/Chrzof1/5327/Cz15g22080.t1
MSDKKPDSNGVAELPESSSASSAATRLPAAFEQLALTGGKQKTKPKYAFWATQPVAQFDEDPKAVGERDGPIDAPKTVQDVKKEPYTLPDSFEWCTCDISNEQHCKEVYELLHFNYVEDDDAMFRFNYSPEFLKWALQPPGFKEEWHTGVRVIASQKLVAFISAIPATVSVNGTHVQMVEINFLCVHKKLRSKRLAPVLIKEITRRVNLHNIWQAAYTAGVVLPTPLAQCRYWHRSLNPKKLIDVRFSQLAPRMTMARTIKLYRLPDATMTPGLRPMAAEDVPAVTALLNKYLTKYRLAPVFSEQEVSHWLRPQPFVIDSYVVEVQDGSSGSNITDLVSFYTLPSSVLGHVEHKELRAAYMFYTVPGSTPIKQLMNDALVLAASKGYDVFNALDLLENTSFLKDLKFGIGDGTLQYYLYNWRVANLPMQPSDVGLILL